MQIPYSGIRDLCLAWAAGEKRVEKVECVGLAPGTTLADYSSFVLTIREDPEWPRSGCRLTVPLDPAEAGGTPAVQATGTPGDGLEVTFILTAPASPGYNRYAFDVWGIGGAAGPTQIYQTTWLTILPSVR